MFSLRPDDVGGEEVPDVDGVVPGPQIGTDDRPCYVDVVVAKEVCGQRADGGVAAITAIPEDRNVVGTNLTESSAVLHVHVRVLPRWIE